jgi:catechol 2,3-dioxygenase-like lactoylglutathione lyase family enzyme
VPENAQLDHVALALPERAPFWSAFAGDLGGRWAFAGESLGGFAFAQLRFANGMKIEGLEPFSPETNDFLVRFLATSGPGPHHLTFKVPDLDAYLLRARSSGYRPMGVERTNPLWKESFLHPREACGILVQVAWSEGDPVEDPPPWLPAPRTSTAELVHVAHAVADLEEAVHLFKGLLGGRSVDAGAGGGLGWVDLAWAGDGPDGVAPGRLRLLAGDPVASWIDHRAGRLHHLAFRVEDPAGVAGAVRRDGWWEVPAAPALGTRLVLVEPGADVPMAL